MLYCFIDIVKLALVHGAHLNLFSQKSYSFMAYVLSSLIKFLYLAGMPSEFFLWVQPDRPVQLFCQPIEKIVLILPHPWVGFVQISSTEIKLLAGLKPHRPI